MSPNPGEPGHNLFGFTHAICDRCYATLRAGRNWSEVPNRVRDLQPVTCCFCGNPSGGIFVRAAANEVHSVS